MKKVTYVISILLLAAIVLLAGDSQKYGSELTLKETTKISDILEKPDTFDGKKVLVEGTVVGVCETRGCWIEIAGEKPYEKIKVKVNDGEIVFPMEAKGKKATVEGEVYSIVPEVQSECGSTAEGEKSACSEETKKTEEGCCPGEKKVSKIYMIKGLGAVIG